MKAKDLYTQNDGKFQKIFGGYSGVIEPGIMYCWNDGYQRWIKNHHHFEYNVQAIHPDFVILECGARYGIQVKAEDCDIRPVESREEVLVFVSQSTCCDKEISDDRMKEILGSDHVSIFTSVARKQYWVNRPPTHWGTGTYRKDGDVWRRIASDYDSSD